MKKIKNLLLYLVLLGMALTSNAQQSKYGYQLPAKGTVRVLIVFAELIGTCGDSDPHPYWPTGTAAPLNANMYLDPAVLTNYTTKLSRYYKEISLGEYDVLGDYWNGTVQVPCSLYSTYGNAAAIVQLNTDWAATGGQYLTAHGLNLLTDFDNYQSLSGGQLKNPGNPDGNYDATVILWRNSPAFGCGSGYGVGNFMSANLKGKNVSLYGSWDFCPEQLNGGGYDGFFVAEYFHSIFGSNNFHTGGGAASGTFQYDGTASWSTTAQSGSASNIVCGWDRNFMDWKGTRNYPISALNLSSTEVPSDISISSNPGTTYFVLKDFVTVGDAVRIKLPHFNWTTNGDKKNQYLWLENHQLVGEFDKNKTYGTCDSWVPGLYAYVQAGKDFISGSSVYGGASSSPNELNDWLFPMPAEGRWDYFYSFSDKNLNPNVCAWNNYSLPYSKYYPNGSQKPNPFTGYTDAYGFIDSDGDGKIVYGSNDLWQPRLQKWTGIPTVGSPPAPTIPTWGDAYDAFTTTGQKMSIATNPAPVPVYTIIEQANSPSSYDNRSIHLNNLSIEIINSDYYNVGTGGPHSFLIAVKWDDKAINNDVRWCGNIVLRNDPLDPALRSMEIDLKPNKIITVDKGLSPVKLLENTPGSGDFSEPSILHLLNGTITTLESGSQIKVINGSTFHVQSGATLIIGPNAKVDIDATSIICIENGANVIFQDPITSKIFINGIPYGWDTNLSNVVLATLPNNYYALNTITTSGTSPGVTMPASGNVLLQAKNLVRLLPKTVITPSSGQSFIARINDPYNCSNVNNYNLAPILTGDGSSNSNSDGVLSDNMTEDDSPFYSSAALTGKIEELSPEKIVVFPNPADSKLYIKFNKAEGKTCDVKTFNSKGQLIYDQHFNDVSETLEVNIEDWTAGIYLFQIRNGNEITTKKIIIQ